MNFHNEGERGCLKVSKSNPFQTTGACPRSWTVIEKSKLRPEISAEAHQWEQTPVQIPAVVAPSLVYVPTELQTLFSCLCSFFPRIFLLTLQKTFSIFEAALMFGYARCCF